MFGARRNNIPWESEGPDTGRRFQQGRAPIPRMAGDVRLATARSGQLDAPYGVGRGFVPEERDAWEVEDSPTPWQTFDENLDPYENRPYG
jgi:hypothetical protein